MAPIFVAGGFLESIYRVSGDIKNPFQRRVEREKKNRQHLWSHCCHGDSGWQKRTPVLHVKMMSSIPILHYINTAKVYLGSKMYMKSAGTKMISR